MSEATAPPPESATPAATPPAAGWRRFVRPALRWAEHILAATGLFFLLYFLCFDLSFMVTASMEPTLRGSEGSQRDWILTEKISSWFSNPRRWEVITFHDRDGNQVMKRVVGLPGETVSLPDVGRLHINGTHLARPERLEFLRYLPYGNLAQGASVPCAEGWFVLGDQLHDSLDSRYEGPVPRRRIVGSAWLVVWPLSRFGRVR